MLSEGLLTTTKSCIASHIFKEPDDRLYEGDERICTNMQDTTEVPYRMNNTDDELLKSTRTIIDYRQSEKGRMCTTD